MITAQTRLNEQMIDAMREVLGFEPLYHARKETELWDSMAFKDGNHQTKVTNVNGTPRPVPAIRGEKFNVSVRDIAKASGLDRFMHRGSW